MTVGNLEYDSQAAIELLTRWMPNGPWHLVAIAPNGGIEAKTFYAGSENRMLVWLNHRQGSKNLYFHVNHLHEGVIDRKAKKEDVASAAGLHVDVDRLDSLPSLLKFNPSPTVTIFTGGGFQAFWSLSSPETALDIVEDINIQIASIVGGDHCHDVSRIMRLPGTINVPTAKKRAKGRVPDLARVEQAHWDKTYSVADFDNIRSTPRRVSNQQKLPDGGRDGLAVLDQYELPKRFYEIICEGRAASEGPKEGDDSRSVWLFDVCCGLVRHQVPDECILSLITDPRFRISDSVREKNHPLIYALRQVEKAKRVALGELAQFSLTDVGNAQRLAQRSGEDMRFCHQWGSWLIWDGTRYQLDRSGAAHRAAKSMADSIYGEARKALGNSGPDQASIARWARQSQMRRGIEAALAMAQSELPVMPEELDANDGVLNVNNGTLDLLTGQLRKHSRTDLITRLAPVNFDAAAACLQWHSFLNQIYGGDQELVRFVRRAFGYSLTGSIQEQVAFLLVGTGANGKSTLCNVLLAILGDYAKPTEFRTFTARPNDGVRNDIAALAGLRVVTATEVTQGRQLDEALIKLLTGGDEINARFLHKEFFSFRPKFKIYLAANHRPEVRMNDEAIWRRLLVIPHDVVIPPEQRDPQLFEKLKVELPGILNWALEGLRDWRHGGLRAPMAVSLATAEYRDENDTVAGFIRDDCMVRRGAENIIVGSADLYNAYRGWCERASEDPLPAKQFGSAIAQRGFPTKVLQRKRVRVGLRVLLPHERNQGEKGPV